MTEIGEKPGDKQKKDGDVGADKSDTDDWNKQTLYFIALIFYIDIN